MIIIRIESEMIFHSTLKQQKNQSAMNSIHRLDSSFRFISIWNSFSLNFHTHTHHTFQEAKFKFAILHIQVLSVAKKMKDVRVDG